MAEKADKKAEKPKEEAHGEEGEAAPKKKGGLLTKMPVLVGGVMLLEAVALFGAVKFLGIGAPKAAQAEVSLKEAKEGGEHGEGAAEGEGAEKKEEAAHGEKADAKAEGGHGEKKEEAAGGHGAAAGGKEKEDPNAKKPFKGVQEVAVVKFKAMNRQAGKPFVYNIEVVAAVKLSNLKLVESVLNARKSTLEDRIRTIIAQSDPDKLSAATEPGLETLRRQIKHEIEQLSGEGTIIEVLVPQCIGFSAY